MIRASIVALCAYLSCAGASAQEAGIPTTGQALPPVAQKQYKRVHQRILKALLQQRPRQAAKRLQAALAAQPRDAETRFLETLVAAAAGDTRTSLAAMQKALELGLPAGRFLAGPRELLAPIADQPAFQRLLAAHRTRLVHGPMLGDVTHSSVRVWLRTSVAAKVTIRMTPGQDGTAKPVVRAESRTYPTTDFTTTVHVTGLEPSTRYTYTVQIADGATAPGGSFKTTFLPDDYGRFSVAFGGGAGYVPEHERMWNTIAATSPDLLLLMGDNIYSDAPNLPAMQRYCYYRRQSRQEFRQLVASTPVYAIWDDHDFGTNDCYGGPLPDQPAWKKSVYKLFSQNWANPAYGNKDAAGCFFDFQIGNVYFIMLDGRCFREDPTGSPSPSMLGPVQLAWLRGKLAMRREVFKVICSPVPWSFATKGQSRDTWNGFREERNEIFDFLTQVRVEGVLLLSADRHRTDIWKIDRPKQGEVQPYPLIELMSSRLTNQHVHKEMPAAEFSYNRSPSFGLLQFDTAAEDPSILFKVVNIDGTVVHTKLIHYSSLCFK